MINLFENYNAQAFDLEHSLRQAGFTHTTIVLEENGFMPEHVQTPVGYFTGMQKNHQLDVEAQPEPLFFNEVKVPFYWEIRGDSAQAEIFEGYKKMGHIKYSKRENDYRVVSAVEWYNDAGRVRQIDMYNQFGERYGKCTYSDGSMALTTYFDDKGREVILENHVTGTVQVNHEGKHHVFENFNDFILFFMEVANIESNEIFYNNLGRPFFITNRLKALNPEKNFAHTLFWQETSEDIPGNMRSILDDSNNATRRIVVQDSAEFERIMRQLEGISLNTELMQLGYLYPLKNRSSLSSEAFIFTNSAEIEALETIVTALPEMHFHIAARTTMSPSLMAYENRDNVSVYPNVGDEDIIKSLKNSSFYLDINHANEMENIIRQAFEYNQLILAFDNVVHNKRYTAAENIFSKDNAQALIDKVKIVSQDNTAFQAALKTQHKHAGQVDISDYQHILN